MIITLIGKDILYKIKLPEIVAGNYWITDENDKKLINIEAQKNTWRIISNANFKIIKDNSINSLSNISKIAITKENVVQDIILREYGMYYIYLKDYPNDLFVLYCSPNFEEDFTYLNIRNSQDIIIGKEENCQIIYNNPLVEAKHARIFYSNGKLMLENFDYDFGTFINGIPVGKKLKLLFNGDVIFIMGLKIIIVGRTIVINNPAGRVKYDESVFEVNKQETKILDIENEDEDTDIELYSEKEDYFARAPRITNIIEREQVKIDPPPANENKEGTPLLYLIGSSLSMGIIMIISMISTTDNFITGNATAKSTAFSLITSIAFLMSIILIPVLNRRWEKNKKIKNEINRQKRYREYINSKIDLLDDIMKKQKNVLYEKFISSEECAQIIINNGSRLWERKIEEDDFLTVRIGIGDMPIEADIEYPHIEFTMEDDNLIDILNTIVNKSKIVKDVPITVSLAQKNISALIVENDDRLIEKFVQNLIIQLITLHSYEDLKLVFMLKKDVANKWEHMKTLPHIWDNNKQFRFWAEDYDDMMEISRYLEIEFNNRAGYENIDYKDCSPYYLIITDDYKKIENLNIVNKILGVKRNLGFGIFCITNNLLDLPNECKTFITLKNNEGEIFENEITSKNKKKFHFDSSYTFFFEKVGKQLSSIPIKYKMTSQKLLPNSYTFLEMYDAGKIEQLNISERWRKNNPINSLKAKIGIDPAGMPIMLDVHEKGHGPHGLIAGGTGSGKSEFIKTFILSLTMNYHPYDVNIIIIDYKGGDVAGAFQKKETKLPHLVGTITNIDTLGLQRSLDSIQSELRRRQILFNEARNKIDDGTIDIYKYQKLYHEGILKEPVPHLLIICDEFAELKQQQSDFMDELISVARIGRSLGVHLILATQKPAGIVNDQIRSNSKFGVCLKVQDKMDSIDVIKRPDAANLRQAGQFYLQVGNDEYFTLGRVAWSGAPYNPTDVIKKNVDSSVKIVSDIGMIIKEVGKTQKKLLKNSKEQITCIVKYMYELAQNEGIKSKTLWLKEIPAIIFIDELRKKYKNKKENNNISAIIGEFDDPANQRQGLVELNLSKQGNVIIYGNAESGKETLLSTLIYDLMTSYKTDDIQMYILDFGSEALKIFKNSPYVGDVVFINDNEKIKRLFDMLIQEIKERTRILSDYNGDYDLYKNTAKEKMPMLLIIVNNYEIFAENYKDQYDETLQTLSREGLKYGIVFIVTVSSYNGLRYRLSQNFRQKVALQLNNGDEYYSIFNKVGKKRPANIFGRGLIEMENIYEFQTARIVEPEKWNLYIKETIEKLKDINETSAKKIPVMPEIITIENVKEELEGLSSVPIGINKKSLKIYTYDFKKNFVSIISGKNIETLSEFISSVLTEMNQLEDVETVVLDAEQIIQLDRQDLKTVFEKFVLDMTQKQKHNKHIVCAIIGIDKLFNDLNDADNTLDKVFSKAYELKNYSFIILDSISKLKKHEFNLWYKKYVSNERAIWIGNGVIDQYVININFNNKNIINRCGDSYGHVIDQDNIVVIKLLGVKENGDNNG